MSLFTSRPAHGFRRLSRQRHSQQGFGKPALAIALVAVLLAGWGLLSRQRAEARLRETTETQIARPVSTVNPSHGTSEQQLSLPGNVQAQVEAPIYARTSGYLKRWNVDIGATVKAGQVLAEIDAPELDQQLLQGRADLANIEAANHIAQTTAQRWRGLRDSDSVSQQEADEKISAAAASTAAVAAARANVQRLQELSDFKKIVAPFDGIVTARNTDIGQLITAGSSGNQLFRVADLRRLRVYVRVPQNYAAAMQPDMAAELSFPDRPGLSYTAHLVRTANALDASSRTLLAELAVDNAKRELLPGAYVEVHFHLQSTSTALRLPANTLLFRGAGPQVAVVGADARVQLKSVQLGRDFGTEIEVLSGVDATDRVIQSPSDSLTEAAQVRIVQPAADGAAS